MTDAERREDWQQYVCRFTVLWAFIVGVTAHTIIWMAHLDEYTPRLPLSLMFVVLLVGDIAIRIHPEPPEMPRYD